MIKIDVPVIETEPLEHLRTIHWCEGHWAELVTSLRERGLEDQISQDAEELNQKFAEGKLDPCWEATNTINMGALEIFGPEKIVDENAGCPVCAFANMIRHVSDLVALRHGSSH